MTDIPFIPSTRIIYQMSLVEFKIEEMYQEHIFNQLD